jgi:succinate-semialdehyde dehydrogenase/glutarate-semialdehyde dehydrogenase
MNLAEPSLLKDKCLVDGKWVGEGVDPIENPATGALIAKAPRFGHTDAVGAIEAAARAFSPWAKALPKERAQILRRWFDLIIMNREDIALIMTSEQGGPSIFRPHEIGPGIPGWDCAARHNGAV